MGVYAKKTNHRRYVDREFSVRPVHRQAPDMHKLCEVLIRITLQETGQARAVRRAGETPETYREPLASAADLPKSEPENVE